MLLECSGKTNSRSSSSCSVWRLTSLGEVCRSNSGMDTHRLVVLFNQERCDAPTAFLHLIFVLLTDDHGEYHHLFKELWNHPDRFKEYMRITPATFDVLPELVKLELENSIARHFLDPFFSSWYYDNAYFPASSFNTQQYLLQNIICCK